MFFEKLLICKTELLKDVFKERETNTKAGWQNLVDMCKTRYDPLTKQSNTCNELEAIRKEKFSKAEEYDYMDLDKLLKRISKF